MLSLPLLCKYWDDFTYQNNLAGWCSFFLRLLPIRLICKCSKVSFLLKSKIMKLQSYKSSLQLGEGEVGEASPTLFWKSKKVPWFWKKGPNCVHPWVESFIQNVVLGVSRRKNSKFSPAGSFFLAFLTKFIEMSWFHKTSPALKNVWLFAWKYIAR